MTTSGSVTFSYSRNQIIKAALRKVGAIAAGETPDNTTIQDAADQLNAMVKAWMASGIHLWTVEEAILFVQIGQIQYTLGPSSDDHVTQVFTQTLLSSDVASGASTVVVASNTSVTVGVDIGITLDDGTLFWTTVSSFSGTTLHLADALDDSATAGLDVYITSPNINRPLRIPAARRWNSVSGIETPLISLSRLDYQNLPNKTQTGEVTQYYYNPRGGATNTGALFLWPAPSDTTTNSIKFTWYRPIEVFDTSANTPDFPEEWTNALVWNLAQQMALEYDCPPTRYALIVGEAAKALDLAQGWDREPESTYFGVDFTQQGR